MKTVATLIALSSALMLSAPVLAEPFNDRGFDIVAQAPLGSSGAGWPVRAALAAYNEQGDNFVVSAPAGSQAPRMAVMVAERGFNERGFNAI